MGFNLVLHLNQFHCSPNQIPAGLMMTYQRKSNTKLEIKTLSPTEETGRTS